MPIQCSDSSSATSSLSKSNPRGKQPLLGAAAAEKMDSLVSICINTNALSFSLPEDESFQQMIDFARYVPKGYKCPRRKKVAGSLLDNHYSTNRKSDLELLMKDVDDFGLGAQGDGATIMNCPFLNHIIMGVHHASVRKITDCSDWVAQGRKKDGTFVANEMMSVMLEIDPYKRYVDFCLFDGAHVCGLAQTIMQVEFPRLSVATGADHSGNSILKFWAEIPNIVAMIKQDKVSQCSLN